jgi:hypothetical protein
VEKARALARGRAERSENIVCVLCLTFDVYGGVEVVQAMRNGWMAYSWELSR